jgi:hypothetical protein
MNLSAGENAQQWSVSDLPAGTYILHVYGTSALFVKP